MARVRSGRAPYTGLAPQETGLFQDDPFAAISPPKGTGIQGAFQMSEDFGGQAAILPAPVVPEGRSGQALSWLARHWAITLTLLCLVLWTPGILSLPPIDRDESRFAEASRQMLESRDFIDIKFGHVPRYQKPVGIYWIQSLTTAIAGLGNDSHIWTYRLASLLGGWLSVLLCFWCVRAFARPEVAWLAGALMGTSLLLTAESSMATTDACQLACVMGSMGVLMRVWLATRPGSAQAMPSMRLILVGWAAFAAGILIKGPVVPGVCVVTILALIAWQRGAWRWLAALKPLYGVPLVLAVDLPWLITIGIQSHGAFYQQSLGHDFAAKLAGGQESHGAPPGLYLALVTLTFWPAILFVAPGIGAAIRGRAGAASRFLLCWAGASWLMIELVPTKLPNYILPAYPPLAMLAALWILWPRDDTAPRWQTVLGWLSAVQFAIGAAALVAAPILATSKYADGTPWWLIGLAVLTALLALAALITYLQASKVPAFLLASLAVLVAYPTLTVGAAPRLERIWISPCAAQMLAKYARPGDPPPIAAGYIEPSLMFALGSELRLTDGEGAAEDGAYQGGLALIEDAERPAFLAHLAELQTDAQVQGQLDGFNYTRGRPVHITLYRVTATHEVVLPPAE
jgi:4-amino-4-deoxy-L-arabinose transferase-like glycosyltransferase